jgi:protein SCO1/2
MQVENELKPAPLRLSPRWALFGALALAVPLAAMLRASARPEPLPVLAELPAFELKDQLGRPFGRRQMLGHVSIANFIFTSCAEACPRLTQKIRALQDRLTPREQGGAIALVSVTVDPERDTPEKLRTYAQSFGANEAVWRFVTGPQAEVERTVVKGFRVAMAKLPAEPGSGQAAAAALAAAEVDPKKAAEKMHMEAFDIVHGEQLVLVDLEARIRGYYPADEQGTERLLRDARALAAGGT